ncbi:MAG: phage portal protein [Clostridia bacterium]|nr:phage portal protein [Clostridia bacterium]
MDNRVIDFLKSKSISIIDEDISTKLRVWEQWYKGKVDGFHDYKVYQGKREQKRERLSLNMPQRVCQDWADLLLNEKVEINADDEKTQAALDRVLSQVNFYVRGNNLLERSFAFGSGFFIQYYDGEKTNQKYITQDFLYPITYDSGALTEAAFASSKIIGGREYTYIETHTRDEHGFYVIDNFICTLKRNKLIEVGSDFYEQYNIQQKLETGRTEPCFQQIRPNVANKDNFNSPFGTSIFNGAIDCFKACDTVFDAYYKEFKLGQKRLFVKDGVTTFNFDEEGKKVPVFDPNDEVFYSMPDDDNSKAIEESNMQLRVDELDKGLQTQLNLISQSCGFGSNGYKWDNGNVTTATQIISENSKMFRTVKKHEILLNNALIAMAKSLLYFEKQFGGHSEINENSEITINFDDSIIEDTAEIKRQALTDYTAGIISKTEYFRQVYKLNDAQALDFARKMAEELEAEGNMSSYEEKPELEE